MDDAHVVYEYTVIAGKGMSTAESLAEAARQVAADFFGDREVELRVDVTGRKEQWIVSATASATVKLDGHGR